jgi:glycosyltransferase involved in cell wall biosynthesis
VKIAIVVQRYGAEINGGAELHARFIAERLAKHVHVEVLTTCATDYITWRNALPPGPEEVNGITVRRFAVSRERDPAEFGRMSELVFTRQHAVRDELAWLEAEGPTSPDLVTYVRQQQHSYDFFVFFSVRYYHAYHGARAVPAKAILVPTAERDSALGLAAFGPVFRGVRAIMYNSFEERTLIQTVSRNHAVPGVVVGVGSEIPPHSQAARFRQKFDMRDRFAIYIGRIDENKGCAELFDYFQRYTRMFAEGMHLVLIGNPVIPIPKHPRIHHLGFVADRDKFDALAAAELLIMPSYLESLSMVALEAWAMGKPVLANGRCDVLRGQCIRSNGGLYYDNFPEFIETLRAIDFNPSLASALGANGGEYFNRHYSWPVVERKYLDMLQRLSAEAATRNMEPLPGWFARRRNDVSPADEVVAALPTGPSLDREGVQPVTAEAGGPSIVPRDAKLRRRVDPVAPRREEPSAAGRSGSPPMRTPASDSRPAGPGTSGRPNRQGDRLRNHRGPQRLRRRPPGPHGRPGSR